MRGDRWRTDGSNPEHADEAAQDGERANRDEHASAGKRAKPLSGQQVLV